MITDWFRSKRAAIADRDRYRALTIKQTDELADLREQADTDRAAAHSQIHEAQESLSHALYTAGFERSLREGAEERLALVVEELHKLHKLREEIRQAEESGNLPSAAGPGMARPAVRVTRPAPVRGSLAARVQARPLPADLADAIDEETTAKRREDI